MKRKRSFFLLEVMIAVLLVGVFAYVSLQGFASTMLKQRKIFKEIEYSRLADLKRMELLEKKWATLTELVGKEESVDMGSLKTRIGSKEVELNAHQKYKISCQKQENGPFYLLKVIEIRPKELDSRGKQRKVPYYYFIARSSDERLLSAPEYQSQTHHEPSHEPEL